MPNRAALVVLSFALLTFGRAAHSAESSPAPDAYVAELIARAHASGLWSSEPWLRLGHYRSKLSGALESQADGPGFFLAGNGKRDPAAEGEATLRALFSAEDPSVADPKAEHALCRFPARRELLVDALGIAPDRLPKVSCAKLEAFIDRVEAKSVTFSFSAYYLGNPSSIFGHTFLRLNKDQRTEDGKQKELLDYGVNFAGEADTNNPILYAVKGFTGRFRGYFTHLPYFYKVREYNDFESRDLWEYRLALTPEEVRRLVLHLWELGHTYFDYYYADENCSWHLLAALEAAAPRVELLRHLKPLVTPSDALQALFHNDGLVSEVRHRPSLRSQFEARASKLNASELSAVRALEADPAHALDGRAPEEQARLIDAAMDYLDLRHAKDLVFDRAPEAAARRHKLFARRARLGLQSDELKVEAPKIDAPHRAHPSVRMGMGGGVGDGGPYAEYRFRALMHDLLDPPAGYPRHTAMEFLPLRLRYLPERGQVQVEDAQLFRVINVSPATRFESRMAWSLQLGAQTLHDGGCERCLVGAVEGGAGVAVEPFEAPLLFWAQGSGQLAAGPGLSGVFGSAVRPSVGPTAGLRWHAGEWLSTQLSGGAWLRFERARRLSWDAAWTTRLHLSPSTSLELEVRRNADGVEAGAAALFYF